MKSFPEVIFDVVKINSVIVCCAYKGLNMLVKVFRSSGSNASKPEINNEIHGVSI